jgi:hypothetical protein
MVRNQPTWLDCSEYQSKHLGFPVGSVNLKVLTDTRNFTKKRRTLSCAVGRFYFLLSHPETTVQFNINHGDEATYHRRINLFWTEVLPHGLLWPVRNFAQLLNYREWLQACPGTSSVRLLLFLQSSRY